MNLRCLGCYLPLEKLSEDYHPKCARKIFGVAWIPKLLFERKDFPILAQGMAGGMSISGVQPKILVDLERKTKTLEPAPSGGLFILKPQTESFPHLPENEDLCMHLASLYEIALFPHGLVKLADGSLAFVTKRFDQLNDGTKLPVEDFAQILGVPREKKYSGSYERIGHAILNHCTHKFLELLRFFDRLLFCFAIGNGDMHLKNFSLITLENGEIALSPAYDLLSSKLVLPNEEDLPLTLTGKKNKLSGKDFVEFGSQLGLAPKAMENSINRLISQKETFGEWIERSFLPDAEKKRLKEILVERLRTF